VPQNQGQIKIAKSYVNALFDVVTTKKDMDAVAADMLDLSNMISNSSELKTFLKSPLLSIDDHKAGLEKLIKKAKLSQPVSNMLMVMADNRRLPLLSMVTQEVQNHMNRQSGVIPVVVTTASKLTAADQKKIASDLKVILGGDVVMQAYIDETIIGGVVIKAGSTLIDGSVRSKLDRLERELLNKAA